MARLVAKYAPAVLVAALLVATAAAFVYAEKLKLTPNPILGTRVDKVFSPVCACETGTATISFRLRRRERVTVDVIDNHGDSVRTLVKDGPTPRGRFSIDWNGRDDTASIVPEGSYRPRVHLAAERRTIVLPNPIRVDVTPPRVELVGLSPRVFSPDGDGRAEKVVARYRVDERAGVLLYVDGEQRVRKRGQQRKGRIEWFGRLDGRADATRRVSAEPRRAGRRRQRRAAHPGKSRADPVRRPRPRSDRDRSRDAVCGPRAERRGEGGMAPGQTEWSGPPRDPAPSRPGAAGPLHADGVGQRVQHPRRRVREGAEAVSVLAQIAGPVGCAGLALLLVGDRRSLRIVGLAAWGVGLAGLALYLAPDVEKTLLAGAAVGASFWRSAGRGS